MTGCCQTPRLKFIVWVALLASCAWEARASVQISSKPTQNMSCTGGVCVATARKAVLNADDLAGMLATGNVTVSSGQLAKDIKMSASLSWSSTSQLTLDAYRSLSFTKTLDVAGNGGLTILTDDGGSGGDFTFRKKGRVAFHKSSSNNSLIINGNTYSIVYNIRELRSAGRTNTFPYIALGANVDSSHALYTSAPIPNFGLNLEGLGNTISHLQIQDSNRGDFVGLIGVNAGSVENTTIRDLNLVGVNIQGSGSEQVIGALAGTTGEHIVDVSVTGQVSSSIQNAVVGGLVGENSGGFITQSRANVAVSGVAQSTIGGLAGTSTGGCMRTCFGIIAQSYSTGSVTGADSSEVGGIVGENIAGELQDTYAMGTVSGGNSAIVGGLIGSNESTSTDSPMIVRCYSAAAVSAGTDATLGGVLGQDIAQVNTSDAYWDLDTSGISDPSKGAGNIANDPGIAGLTTTQFQSGLPTGFSNSVWAESVTINGGYPYLLANPAE